MKRTHNLTAIALSFGLAISALGQSTDGLDRTVLPISEPSVETPQWMLDLFKAIDALDMSPTSGFAIFADDIEMLRKSEVNSKSTQP